MIKFTRLKATDTFAYRELDFAFVEGIHSLKGINGSSKSSVFATLSQCLFNKNIKNIKVPGVDNNITGKPYEIECWFLKGDKEYYIKNSKKTGGIEIRENGKDKSLKRIPDNLKLIEDILGCGYAEFKDLFYQSPKSAINLLDTDSDIERKKFINKVLRLDELDFHLDRMKNAEKELQGKNGKIQILQKQVETYESGINTLHEELEQIDLTNLETVLADTRETLDANKQLQSALTERRRTAEKDLVKAKATTETANKLAQAEARLKDMPVPVVADEEAVISGLAELQETKTMLSVALSKATGNIIRYDKFKSDQETLNLLQSNLAKFEVPEKDLEFCNSNLDKLNAMLSTKTTEVAQKRKELASLESAGLKGTCPTCGAGVDKDKFVVEVSDLKAAVAEIDSTVDKCKASIDKYGVFVATHKSIQALQTHIDKLKANPDADIDGTAELLRKRTATEQIDALDEIMADSNADLKLHADRKALESTIANLSATVGEAIDVAYAKTTLELLDQELSQVGTLISRAVIDCAGLGQEVENGRNHNALSSARKTINAQIKENNSNLQIQIDASKKELLEAEERLDLVKTWVGILGGKGYRVHKIEGFLKSLNSCMRKYAEVISNGSIQCHFFITEEGEVDFTITDSYKQVEWNCYSEGEKARVKLGCLFAILELLEVLGAVSFNVLCLDEVWGSLDDMGKEGLFRVLDMLRNKGKGVYCIAHTELVLPLTYDSVIRAEKQEDGTTCIFQ